MSDDLEQLIHDRAIKAIEKTVGIICDGCGLPIEDAPYVIKVYPSINRKIPFHSACFCALHKPLLTREQAECIKKKLGISE